MLHRICREWTTPLNPRRPYQAAQFPRKLANRRDPLRLRARTGQAAASVLSNNTNVARGSGSGAADALGFRKPAFERQLRRLESATHAKLVERCRRCAPTTEARVICTAHSVEVIFEPPHDISPQQTGASVGGRDEPGLDAGHGRAMALWLLPTPLGPSRTTFSARSMKISAATSWIARAAYRLRMQSRSARAFLPPAALPATAAYGG
jgi:hypothetical protein